MQKSLQSIVAGQELRLWYTVLVMTSWRVLQHFEVCEQSEGMSEHNGKVSSPLEHRMVILLMQKNNYVIFEHVKNTLLHIPFDLVCTITYDSAHNTIYHVCQYWISLKMLLLMWTAGIRQVILRCQCSWCTTHRSTIYLSCYPTVVSNIFLYWYIYKLRIIDVVVFSCFCKC